MFAGIYKKLIIDFSKLSLFLITVAVIFSLYQSKNFNLDASSDALLLEGDPDLKYLREVNETYGSKDFLVLTYTPVSSFVEKVFSSSQYFCHLSSTDLKLYLSTNLLNRRLSYFQRMV